MMSADARGSYTDAYNYKTKQLFCFFYSFDWSYFFDWSN